MKQFYVHAICGLACLLPEKEDCKLYVNAVDHLLIYFVQKINP